MSGGIADLPSGVLLIVGICRRRVVGAVVIGSRARRRSGINGSFNRIGAAAAGHKRYPQEDDDKKPGGCRYSIHKKDFRYSPKKLCQHLHCYVWIKELYSKFKQ
jgi:hypothetical protein